MKWTPFCTPDVLVLLSVILSCVLTAVKPTDSGYCLVRIGAVLTYVAVDMAWQKKTKKKGNLLNPLVGKRCLCRKEMENEVEFCVC